MTLELPKPEGDPESLRDEIRTLLKEIREYKSRNLGENIKIIIDDVAMNPEVSRKVISGLDSNLSVCRRRYFKISARFWIIWVATIPLTALVQLLWPLLRQLLSINHTLNDVAPFILATTLMLNLEFFLLEYFDWRTRYRDSYIAIFLIRALEFGLGYQSALTDERFRDGLAEMIQRAAVRYSIVYKKSNSTRFFAAQMRRQARNCRNDIMSLVPGLVTAGEAEIKSVNENLTRLLIRTQLGYWHQTGDVAQHGVPMRRRNAFRISLASFIKDRTIQVAFIALAASIIAAGVGLATHI